MLKKTVTYLDFDDNERTETLYFNLTQTELVEFAMELPTGVSNAVGNDPSKIDQDVVARNLLESIGSKGVVDFIKKMLLKSYGIKSEDGRRFMKSEEISNEFSQTLAFDAIFMELMGDDNAAAEFVNGIIPSKVINNMPFMKQNTQELPMK